MSQPGDTFDGFDEFGHLFVVVSEVMEDGRVVVANLMSHYPERRRHSSACVVVEPREHPWVRRPSCVNLERIRIVYESRIQAELAQGAARVDPRCNPNLLRRIQTGIIAFPAVRPELKAAISESMGQSDPVMP